MKTIVGMALSLALLYHLALAGIGLGRWAEARYPQYLPWVPLAISHELGPATSTKLRLLQNDLPGCMAVLEQAQLAVRPMRQGAVEPQCTIPDAVTLQRLHLEYQPSYAPMSCPLAVALSLWERHVVQNAAQVHLDTKVKRVQHYGTYNCRPIRGGRSGSLSTHATATAIDIAGFQLEDGRELSVARHYNRDDALGEFLREVKRGGCRVFGTVLSPDYNAAHADHFHMQQRGGLCR